MLSMPETQPSQNRDPSRLELEVVQKILTGILTERIGRVWNAEEILNNAQMAFLFGRGCHQALERVKGLNLDCDRRNEEGEQCEAHMLFLDLAKAYDSVEYWALEDAMRVRWIFEKLMRIYIQVSMPRRCRKHPVC